MTTRTKFAVILISTGLIMSLLFTSLIRLWSDTFEEVDFEKSFEVKISSRLNNGGTMFIWGEKGKYQIPFSRNLRGKSLMSKARKGDILKKEKNSTKIILIKDGQEFDFFFKKKRKTKTN